MKWPIPSEANCSPLFHEVRPSTVPLHSFCQTFRPMADACAAVTRMPGVPDDPADGDGDGAECGAGSAIPPAAQPAISKEAHAKTRAGALAWRNIFTG